MSDLNSALNKLCSTIGNHEGLRPDIAELAKGLNMADWYWDEHFTPEVREWLNKCWVKGADIAVMIFIGVFLHNAGKGADEVLDRLFTKGFCYYFAVILKDAFKRGHICETVPHGHIVWLDGNNIHSDFAYDIRGVNRDYQTLVPIEKLGTGIENYMHVPGKEDYCDGPVRGHIMDVWLQRLTIEGDD